MAGLVQKLKPTLTTRQWISILKGVLAYTLVFVFVFLNGFSTLWQYPATLTSMVIVSIAGQPGLSVGACWSNGWLGMAGVGIGAGFYAILAKLGHSRVAQGFVLWVILYGLAYIKALSMRYFAFSLLAILVAFNGIYTSALLGGNFEPKYLEDFLKAYAMSFAIVLGINLLVVPISAERELREMLVGSLERISTFTHLIAKTFALEISEEEKVVRDQLNQSIRADFAFLQMKLGQTGLEINWTRWTMADYASMVGKVQQMQQGLITSYSSLIVMEKHESSALALVKRGLEETTTGRAFKKLRLAFDLLITEIVDELAVGKLQHHSPLPDGAWEDFLDNNGDEDLEAGRARSRSMSVHSPSPEVQNQLARVSERLRQEVKGISHSPMASRRGSFSEDKPAVPGAGSHEGTTAVPSARASIAPKKGLDLRELDRVGFMRNCWARFKSAQNEYIARLLSEGVLEDDQLRVEMPTASLAELYRDGPGYMAAPAGTSDAYRPFVTSPVRRNTSRPVKADAATSSADSSASDEKTQEDGLREETAEHICGSAVLRTFSFLFGFEQVVDEISAMHETVVAKDGAKHIRPKRLHLHFLEKVPRPPKKASGMTLREAVAKLSGKAFEEERVSIWVRIARVERWFRSDTSIYAFKTACAVTVYAVFILAPSLSDFFVRYALTGGLVSIVVAMSPVLGQSFLTFVLQICGTGLGTLYGLLILRIFKDVGGYSFNPYGLAVLLAVFAIPMSWIIYTKPAYFAGGLLALNGAGVLVMTEWIYNEVPGSIRPGFDSPAYRAAKSFTALAIAIGIASIFQIFILRVPARRTLRIKLSNLTFALSNYSILFGIYGEALAPIERQVNKSRPPPDPEALATVRLELVRRERQLQQELLALMPLIKFSSAEPAFGSPFQAGVIMRLIRSHQLILDRLREARCATGNEGFGLAIRERLASRLSPYRKQNKRFLRALFYLTATSLATKSPLPHDLPTMLTAARNIQHDALVLSKRLANEPEGRDLLRSQPFLRYWFYLVAYSGVAYQLEAMETELRVLLGSVEDSPFVVREREGEF